jgi:tetratricopeptide (TPR) repeat protein
MKSGLWILAIVVIVAIVLGFFLNRKNENLRAWAEIEVTEDVKARIGLLETFMAVYPGDEHREEAYKMYANLLLKEVGDSARFIAYAEELLESEIDPDIKDLVYSGLDRARNTRGMLTRIGEIEDPEARIAAAEGFLTEFPDTRNKDRAYYLMGNTMVEGLQDTARLERLAERVIGKEPDADARAVMYYMLYAVHVDTNPEKSLAAMERLADNPVDSGWIYSYIASDINRRELDPDLALRLCGRALEFAKDARDSADAFDSRGWIYYGQEEYDMAVRDLEAAVAAAEEPDERYLEHLGKAALKAGEPDKTFEALKSLLVLGEYDFARSMLDSLMEARGYSDKQKEKFAQSVWETRIAGAMTAVAFTLSDISDKPFEYDPMGKVTLPEDPVLRSFRISRRFMRSTIPAGSQ